MILQFSVNGQKLERKDENYIVERSSKFLKCEFQFDETWNGLSKVALFVPANDTEVIPALIDESGICEIPTRVSYNGGICKLAVMGCESEDLSDIINNSDVDFNNINVTTSICSLTFGATIHIDELTEDKGPSILTILSREEFKAELNKTLEIFVKSNTYTKPELDSKFDSINSELKEEFDYGNVWRNVDFDNVVEGIVYSTSKKSGTEWAIGHTFEKNVVAGEEYKITTSVIENGVYSVCMFYNGNEFIESVELYNGIIEYKDYYVTIPPGVTIMRCSTKSSNTAFLKKTEKEYRASPKTLKEIKSDKKYYVEFNGNDCFVKTKYFDGESIIFKLQRREYATNGLPDITSVYIASSEEMTNDLSEKRRILVNNSSDLFSPHVIAVVNNIDGDNPDSKYYTGGAHRSSNGSSGGVPTAESVSWEVFADGENVLNGGIFADNVVIKWTNLIQAYNTTKDDGTGRNVMREDITLKFDGLKIFVDVVHTALEDIKRATYYGLQSVKPLSSTTIFYAGSDTNRLVMPFDSTVETNTNSGDKQCRDIILSTDDNDKMRIHIDDIDLGDFNKTSRDYSAFKNGGKCYFSVIDLAISSAFKQLTNEKTITSGYYEFYK